MLKFPSLSSFLLLTFLACNLSSLAFHTNEPKCNIEEERANWHLSSSFEDSLSRFQSMYKCAREKGNIDYFVQDSSLIHSLYLKRKRANVQNTIALSLIQAHILQYRRDYVGYLRILNEAYLLPEITTWDSLYIIRGFEFCYAHLGLHGKHLEQLMLCHQLEKRIDPESYAFRWTDLAIAYSRLGEYDEAIRAEKRFLISFPHHDKTEHGGATHLNNIGYYFFKLHQLDSAEWYYQQSLKHFNTFVQKPTNKVNPLFMNYFRGLVQGNLAQLKINKGEYGEAIPLLQLDILGSKNNRDFNNLGLSWVELSKCYLQINQNKKALQAIDSAEKYTPAKGNLSNWLSFMKQKAIMLAHLEKYNDAYLTQGTLIAKSDSTRLAKELVLGKVLSASIREEENRQIISSTKKEAARVGKELKIIVVFSIITLLLLITLVYYVRRLIKKNQEIEGQKSIISKTLKEKEVLLKEVHHRVKNNMQSISSMLLLQNKKFKDSELSQVLQDGRNRLQAMALIHQKLYQNDDISQINFKSYLEELIVELDKMSQTKKQRIRISLDSKIHWFDIDTALPLGLIVNELVTNALKHAFDSKKGGGILIAIEQTIQDKYCLTVTDNGKGIPKNFQLKEASSLGLKMVNGLAQQIGGTFDWKRKEPGTLFSITFKEQQNKQVEVINE